MSNRASFRNRYASEGGGLSGATATIIGAKCLSEYDAGGKFQTPSAALKIDFEVEGREDPLTWHYTLGDSTRWAADKTGNFFEPLFTRKGGGEVGIGKHTEVGVFLDALEANAPKLYDAFCDEGAGALDGLSVRLGVAKLKKKSGKESDVYVIEEVLGDDADGGDEAETVESVTQALITQILADGPVKVALLASRIMALAKARKDVRALMQQAQNKAFLQDEAHPWTYNEKKGTLTLDE